MGLIITAALIEYRNNRKPYYDYFKTSLCNKTIERMFDYCCYVSINVCLNKNVIIKLKNKGMANKEIHDRKT